MTQNEQIQKFIEDLEASGAGQFTYEEAKAILESNGELVTEGGGPIGFPFLMEGIEDLKELKTCSLFGSSTFLAYNMAVKGKKGAEKFEEGEFYLGTTFKKDEEGNLILDECNMGTHIGEKANLIIIGNSFYKNRSIYGLKDPDFDAVMTTFANDTFEAGQKQMIDHNSGKTAWDLRNEQIKAYGKLTDVPKEEKIGLMQYIFGLVETEDGWKPFWMKQKFNMNEDSITMVIQELVKNKELRNKIVSFESYYDQKTQRFFKRATIEGDVGAKDKKLVLTASVNMGASSSELKKKQIEYIASKVGNSEDKGSSDPEFDDDDEINF